MVMNRDVFLSILAMDSYNRGYGANVGGLSQSGGIGTATIGINADDPAGVAQSAGFYAIAYNWNGQKVISYRGTNFEINWSISDFLNSPAVRDAWNGWSVGGGFSPTGQSHLAIEFYEAATGVGSIYDSNGGTTILTGHSLGGGLAGYVGALGRADSVGFDHMPFLQAAQAQAVGVAVSRALAAAAQVFGSPVTVAELALAVPFGTSSNLYDAIIAFVDTFSDEWNRVKPYTSTMKGYFLEGEVLQGVRALDEAVNGVDLEGLLPEILFGSLANIFGVEGSYSEDVVQKTPISNRNSDELLNLIELHSMSLLTVNLFGEKQWSTEGGGSDWETAAKYIFPYLSSDEIGNAIGLGDYPGVASAGATMSTMIAYSAINEGDTSARPFGLR